MTLTNLQYDAGDVANRALVRSLLIYLSISIAVIVWIFPLLWVVLSSIKPGAELFSTPPQLLPSEVVLEHYRYILFETQYPTYLKNSVVVALATTVVTTVTATLAAYGLTRLQFHGRNASAGSMLLLYTIPPVTLMVPLFIIFASLDLNNTLVAVALGHITFALPFSIWFLRAFFKSIPLTYEEAAMCEGASRFQAFRKCVLPLSLPGIATVAVFTFSVSWNDYLFAFIFISESSKRTLTLAITAFAGSQGTSWGMLTALAVLVAIPPFIALLFIKNHLLEGFGIAA